MEIMQKSLQKVRIQDTVHSKPTVTILVPAYNEAGIIKESLTVLSDHMQSLEHKYEWEILVVNDGSKDDTGILADQFAESQPKVRVHHCKVNQNLGGALRRGFEVAHGEYIIVLDIDLSFGPELIIPMMDAIVEKDADIVIASPYMKGGKTTKVPFHRLLFSKSLNKLMRYTSGINIHSFTGMARAYRKEFLDTLNMKTNSYSINPEIIHKATILKGRILEIPANLDWTYQLEYGKNRTSSVRIYKGILNGLMSSFIFRPYGFFMIVGLILLTLSLYMIAWIFFHVYEIYPEVQVAGEFFDDRFSLAVAQVYNKRPHAFLIGGFLFVAAIQFLGLGFISLQKKRYFDELFHINTTLLKRNK